MEKKIKLTEEQLKEVTGGIKRKCPHSNLVRVSNNPPTYKCQDCGELIRPE